MDVFFHAIYEYLVNTGLGLILAPFFIMVACMVVSVAAEPPERLPDYIPPASTDNDPTPDGMD